MAGLRFVLKTAEVAVAANATKTMVQAVAPANQRLEVRGFSCLFDGKTAGEEPAEVQLVRQSTAGTMTALTPVKDDDSLPETIQSTGQHTATAEPTTGDVIRGYHVPLTSGIIRAFDREEVMIKGGGRLGIRVITPVGITAANCVATLELTE